MPAARHPRGDLHQQGRRRDARARRRAAAQRQRAACGSAPSTASRTACCACTGRTRSCPKASRCSTATTSCAWSSAWCSSWNSTRRASRRARSRGGSTRRRTKAGARSTSSPAATGCWTPCARPTRPTRSAATAPAWSTSPNCCCARTNCCATTPALLAHYRHRFGELLVDEFQDTNAIQYGFVRLLAGDTRPRVRGRRRRPGDLRLARRQGREHAALPRATSRARATHPPGAELPLHRQHPQRRQRGDRPQPRPPRQAAVDRRRRRRADRPVRGLQRDRRSALRDRAHPPMGARRRQRTASARSCTAATRSRARSKKRCWASRSRTASTAASASSSAPKSRTRWPTCAWSPIAPTMPRSSARSTRPTRGIGERTLDEVRRARAHDGDVAVGRGARGSRRNRARRRARATRWPAFHDADRRAGGRDRRAAAAGEDRPRADALAACATHYANESQGPARFAHRQPRRTGVGRLALRARRRRGIRGAERTGRVPRLRRARGRRRPGAGGRGRRAADDAALRQGPGVPAGVPGRHGGRPVSRAASRRRKPGGWRRNAAWPTSASPARGRSWC